jgi:hypothetical protein
MIKSIISVLFSLILILSNTSTALTQQAETHLLKKNQVVGLWKGYIELPNSTQLIIEVQLDGELDKLSGKITTPMQGAQTLPLKDIQLKNKSIQFVIDGTPSNPLFKGEIDSDKQLIEGSFIQAGMGVRFKLNKDK